MIPLSSLLIIAAASFIGFVLMGMARHWCLCMLLCALAYLLCVLVHALS